MILRPEYDLAQMASGVRGKYVERYRTKTNLVQYGGNKHTIQNGTKARNTILLTFDFRKAVLVLLDPDVAQAFPNDEAVNEALRLLIQIAQRQQPNTTT